jgi:hypothetical protein
LSEMPLRWKNNTTLRTLTRHTPCYAHMSMPDKFWPEAIEVLPIRFTFESGNLCVSLSRAKYHLAIFSDSRCLMQCYASQHNGALQIKTINKLLRDFWDEGAIISMRDWSSDAPPQNGSFGSLIRTLAEVDLRDPESAASGNAPVPHNVRGTLPLDQCIR